MAEKKYVVPVGGLEAAIAATKNITTGQWVILRDGLEAFCVWISNNTIGPTASQARELIGSMVVLNETSLIFAIEAWQRRMFVAPEPEQEFSEAFNTLTVEINRVGGIKKATEILALALSGEPVNMEPFKPTRFDGATRIVNGINDANT